MMRVVGKVGFVAVALSLIATASAYAVPSSVSTAAFPSEGAVGPRTFLGTGFEASEGYNIGSISTQQGWRCSGSVNAFPPGPGCPGTQVGSPLNSGGVVPKGNGSAQGLFVTQNMNFPNGTLRFAFSPKFKDPTMSTLNVDFRIDDNFGANYYIVPQAPSQGKVVTYLYFYYTGYMYILEDADGHGPGTSAVFRNVGAFTYDQWQTAQITVDHVARLMTVGVGEDKQHLTPLCYNGANGPVCTFDLGASAATGLGDLFEEVLAGSDNNQNTGLGSVSGAPDPGMYVDNIQLKPEPGSLALLAAGALLALRRRTAR